MVIRIAGHFPLGRPSGSPRSSSSPRRQHSTPFTCGGGSTRSSTGCVKKSGSELDERAGLLMPVDRGGDWRVLSCVNPWTRRRPPRQADVVAGQQYLGGHEDGPAHRRTPAAVFLATC